MQRRASGKGDDDEAEAEAVSQQVLGALPPKYTTSYLQRIIILVLSTQDRGVLPGGEKWIALESKRVGRCLFWTRNEIKTLVALSFL